MRTFSTKVAAEVANVHQQTVIRWAKEGFLKPSVPRRKWEPRKYTERDLTALTIARSALMAGLPHEQIAEILKMVQKSDEKQQKNAAIIAVNSVDGGIYGFVGHRWISNVKNPESAKFIKTCREQGVILQQVSLYDIVQMGLKNVREYLAEMKAFDAYAEERGRQLETK